MTDLFMVFDVESVGLHGGSFAVGWVVIDRDGERLGEGLLCCDPDLCDGTDDSRAWIAEYVPKMNITSPTATHMRNGFWHGWRYWADQGAVLVADCGWPVESNFLSACVRLNPKEREWQGPYPLYDLSAFLFAAGMDPLEITARMPDELPAHNPLNDARQSARILVEVLKRFPIVEKRQSQAAKNR